MNARCVSQPRLSAVLATDSSASDRGGAWSTRRRCRQRARSMPAHQWKEAAENKKARIAPGLLHATIETDQPPGANASVRRVVTGAPTGSNFQRLTALSASRSNTRDGVARSTRALVTEPSVPTVISTSTSPEVPERSASAG